MKNSQRDEMSFTHSGIPMFFFNRDLFFNFRSKSLRRSLIEKGETKVHGSYKKG